MDRGHTGLLPRTPRLEDESYLAFMESYRNHAIRGMFPHIAQLAGAAEASGGSADEQTYVRTWKRMMRSQQQLTCQPL